MSSKLRIVTTSKCDWERYDIDDNIYQTSCGHAFLFNDHGPIENNFEYCPYCGKTIELIKDGRMTEGTFEGMFEGTFEGMFPKLKLGMKLRVKTAFDCRDGIVVDIDYRSPSFRLTDACSSYNCVIVESIEILGEVIE